MHRVTEERAVAPPRPNLPQQTTSVQTFRRSEPRHLGLLLWLGRVSCLDRGVGDDPGHGLVDVQGRGGLHLLRRIPRLLLGVGLRVGLDLLLDRQHGRVNAAVLLWLRIVTATRDRP